MIGRRAAAARCALATVVVGSALALSGCGHRREAGPTARTEAAPTSTAVMTEAPADPPREHPAPDVFDEAVTQARLAPVVQSFIGDGTKPVVFLQDKVAGDDMQIQVGYRDEERFIPSLILKVNVVSGEVFQLVTDADSEERWVSVFKPSR